MTVPLNFALQPGQSALVSGDYGQGKSTFVEAWALTMGRGAFWSAPTRPGALPDYARIARVVRSASEMRKAAREVPYVVWPSPPSSVGEKAQQEAFNEFCRVSLEFQEAVIVLDEIQRVLRTKFLKDAAPAFQDLVELGHKTPGRLAKVYVAHRQAQIPLVLGGGAARVSFRPYPGDEDVLLPFFGKECVEGMKRFGIGEFAYWSQATGARWPLKLGGVSRGKPGVPGDASGGAALGQ